MSNKLGGMDEVVRTLRGTGSAPSIVQSVGNVANAAADSGNPVKVGGVYNSGAVALTNGQRGNVNLTVNGAQRVANLPTTDALSAAPPSVAVAASSLVLKNSAGNFYQASIVTGAVAGFLILYNATAAPAGGAALTAGLILDMVPVAANSYASLHRGLIPDRCSAGAVLLFSTATTTYTIPGTLASHLRGVAI